MVIKDVTDYSIDKCEEFLAKSLIVDKKQKQIIKRLYDDREEVVANFSTEIVKKALKCPSFLDCTEGKRLAAYFLLDNLECSEFLELIKEQVKSHDPSKTLCENWGEIVILAWKFAPDINSENVVINDDITKQKLENEIIQDLFYYSIIYPKKYSQKFSWIIDGFLPESVKKKCSIMFFRCLLPILWRNLESINEDIRLAASKLLLKLYPLYSDDDVLNAEYLQKQNTAMDNMLMDPYPAIRIEVIKKVLLCLRLHWTSFPHYIIEVYLIKIVDQLSLDKVDDVRVAVYEGMIHLLYCNHALTVAEKLLKILGKRGINDKSEKVRLSAFKLLNHLIRHRSFKCFDLVEMDNILLRLDFEHSTSVKSEIVKLIFQSFCPRKVEGLDYSKRFKRICYMCSVSRNASLNFHSNIYQLKLMSVDHAVLHIRSLLIAVKQLIKKQNDDIENNVSLSDFDVSGFNIGETTSLSEINGEKRLKLEKDVFDSAIVLWMSLRVDLYTKYPKENSEIIKLMANLLQALDQYWVNTPLIDSALIIASNLPKEKVGRTFQKVSNYILNGEIDQIYFNHYIEALSNWDMDKLVSIINEGLENLNVAVALKPHSTNHEKSFSIASTDNPNENSSPLEQQLPPMKRFKKGKEITKAQKKNSNQKIISSKNLERPLIFLKIMLASPSCSQNLKTNFSFHLTQFCKILLKIRSTFLARIQINNFNGVDLHVLINAYETLTLLSLISKNAESHNNLTTVEEINEIDNDTTMVDANETNLFSSEYTIDDRLFLSEIKWYESILSKCPIPNHILKMFLRCANLYLEGSNLSSKILHRFTDVICNLSNCVDMDIVGDDLQRSTKHLLTALEYCDDQLMAKSLIDVLQQSILKSNCENDIFD